MVKSKLYLLILIILGWVFIFQEAALAETKNVISKNIIYHLGASAQMAKKHWIFSFSKDKCVFHKTKKFIEKDGAIVSVFDIEIPLGHIVVEPEDKTYDSFFQCKEFKNCVQESWRNGEGKVLESKMNRAASLYLKNKKLRVKIYDLFDKLQSLCDRSYYSGPIGLKWGEGVDKATFKLSKKLKNPVNKRIINEIIFQQEYESDFAGFPTEKIYANFIEDQFYEMIVILDAKKSLTQKWHEATQKMVEKYGEPNEISLPSAINSLDDFVNKNLFSNFKVFDLEVKTGNWKPSAKWIYKNNVIISVEVVPYFKKWQTRWRFFHIDLEKSAQVKAEKVKPEDF